MNDIHKQAEFAIEVRSLYKSFGPNHVLDGVSFSVERGKTIALIGPSGCGKTTLLRCLNGLEPVDAGLVRVLGFEIASEQRQSRTGSTSPYNSIDALRADMGFVFQHLYLWPHKTVRQNIIEAPLLLRRASAEATDTLCDELLTRVGMLEKAEDYPHQLSGGQQQRAAIARALAMQPQVLLLDEITSALDPELVAGILDLIADLTKHGRTMIIVTHEMAFARRFADRVLFMDKGKILEDTPPGRFFESPHSARARAFLNRVSTIRK